MFRNIFLFFIIFLFIISCDEEKNNQNNSLSTKNISNDIMPHRKAHSNASKLTSDEYNVLINKGTEYPFTGELLDIKADGMYTCKLCGNPLFKSDAKFNSGTGWPSFDDAIIDNIELVKDGHRIEVICAKCGGHLGHVFYNEGFTDKQTRYCINSVSLNFVNKVDFDRTNNNTNEVKK